METINQKKNFVNRELRISESKFFYKESKFGSETELDISYENLDGEKVSHKTSNTITLSISIILYILAITVFIASLKGAKVEPYAGLFWAVIATIVLFIYWFTKENLWKIKLLNDNHIYLHKNIPEKKIVDEFVTKLLTSRNNYLKENYAIIDENLNYETQLINLKWLKSINALSKIEFDEKYIELKKLVKPNVKTIGFDK